MPTADADVYARITALLKAWSRLRPNKTFSGMSLEDFTKAVAPSRDARVAVDEADARLKLALEHRDEADAESRKLVQRVVNSVKGDRDEGEDGELYAAMGYVPRTVRNSRQSVPRTRAPKKSGSSAGKEPGNEAE